MVVRRRRASYFVPMPIDPYSRRQFVRFLAGSPIFAAAGLPANSLTRLISGNRRDDTELLDIAHEVAQDPTLIATAADAFNVFDFEPVAKKKAPIAHW